jgi:hypothetical protein
MQKAVEQNRPNKLFAIVELTATLALILLQIWILQKRSSWGAYLAAVIILAGWIARKENCKTLGLLGKRYALLIAFLFLGKLIFGHLPFFQVHAAIFGSLPIRVSMYFLWAIVQQVVLNGFFVSRLQCITDERYLPPIWGGVIFSAVHTPNRVLMVAAIIGGTAASIVFLRMKRKNLYLIALVHAAVGMIILYYFHNMRVGPSFYFYQ